MIAAWNHPGGPFSSRGWSPAPPGLRFAGMSEVLIVTTATVLIVDDESCLRDSTRAALELHGYDCLTAGDNASALALAEACAPDVVVTDILHEGPDGLALCRELRERFPALPVILFTGCFLADFEGQDVPDGVDYLMKPATPKDVVRRVERALLLSSIGEDAV